MLRFKFARKHDQLGLSLVELLVAVVIGLVSLLVLMQVGISFEDQKRTTIGGGDSVDASTVALNVMRHTLSMAGYGLNTVDAIGCTVNPYREASASAIGSRTLLPVEITQGTGSGSDTLSIWAGNAKRFSEAQLPFGYDGGAGPLVTSGYFGFMAGDAYLLAEQAVATCLLGEVSGLVTDPLTGSYQIQHQAGSTRYNNPASSGVAFSSSAKIINLGPNPSLTQFSVSNNRLRMTELLSGNISDLQDDVISLQAQYGFNDSVNGLTWSDTVIDADNNGVTGNDGDWQLLNAVRAAIIIRLNKMDKPDASGVCTTSPANVTWSFGTFDISGLDNGRCFRYRVAETVVPLRNIIWSPL